MTETNGAVLSPRTWRQRVAAAAEYLGGLRDGLLVLSGVLYLLGYLAWGIYAWSVDLGPLPTLDAQYLAAGVTPLMILAASVLVFRLLYRLWIWSRTPPDKRRQTWARILGGLGTFLLLISGLSSLALPKDHPLPSWFVAGGVFAFYAGAIVGAASGSERVFRGIAFSLIWFAAIFISVSLVVFYVTAWFPRIPQELGGPAPRCVRLDVDRSLMSAEMRAVLLGPAAARESSTVARTAPVWLTHDGPPFMVLKLATPAASGERWMRLRSDAILGVVPCASRAR